MTKIEKVNSRVYRSSEVMTTNTPYLDRIGVDLYLPPRNGLVWSRSRVTAVKFLRRVYIHCIVSPITLGGGGGGEGGKEGGREEREGGEGRKGGGGREGGREGGEGREGRGREGK